MSDPETPTARALLELALNEIWSDIPDGPEDEVDSIAETFHGAELLRRADEPRVAEGLTVEDDEMDAVLKERDEAIEWADRLAYAIAPLEVIGEHSNANEPWSNALDEAYAFRAYHDALEALPVGKAIRVGGSLVPPERWYRVEDEDGNVIGEPATSAAAAVARALAATRPPEPDRTAALVERLAARQCEASAWYDLPDDGVSRCMDPEYNEEEPAICAPCEARAALAATPEPAPVADQCSVCGWRTSDAGVSVSVRDHMTIAHGLPAPVADGTVEGCQFPECPLPDSNGWHAATPGGPIASRFDHPFTPTPPTDGAA